MLDTHSLLYRSGDIWLPKHVVTYLNTYVIGSDKSLVYVNYWHGMHFLSGVFFGFLQLFAFQFQHPFFVYFFVHTLWEAWQLAIGMTRQNLRGILDICIDTLVGLLGLFIICTISSPNGVWQSY